MKISAWKDFAELVALIAVVGGLVAVVIELRQTQSALRAQAYQTRALDVINTMHELSADPEQAILVSDYLAGDLTVSSASPEALVRLRNHFYVRRTDLDNEHYQFQNGFLDQDFYDTTTKPEIKAYAPHWRAFGILEPRQEFSEEVDRILADPAVNLAMTIAAGSTSIAAESDELAIRKTYNAWVEATNRKDIEEWSTFLATSPYFFPADSPPLADTEAVIDYYARSFSDPWFSLDCEQKHVDVVGSGNMAWSRGSCSATFTGADGEKASGTSRWFKVWIKQSDGSWRCRVNSWKNVDQL